MYLIRYVRVLRVFFITYLIRSEHDSLTVSALACHAADPGSNPAQGDDFSINN